MPVNFDKLEAKIAALQAKSGTTVASLGIPVSVLGVVNASTFDTHKNKLLNILIACRLNTEAQITSKRLTAYNSLSNAGKTQADKVINGTGSIVLTGFSGTELDRLMEILLYQHILT